MQFNNLAKYENQIQAIGDDSRDKQYIYKFNFLYIVTNGYWKYRKVRTNNQSIAL